MSKAGHAFPCEQCPIYLSPRLHPLTNWALGLHAMAFGDEVSRERYRCADLRLPRWKADYVFGVWETYATILREHQNKKQVADAPGGSAQDVCTELPPGWLEARGDNGPQTD